MKVIAVGALMALSITGAGAAEDTSSANYWMPHCKAHIRGERVPLDPAGVARLGTTQQCAGFVAGIMFTVSYLTPTFGDKCAAVPTGVTYEQAIRVVVRYIDERPQRMHEGFGALALEAIYDAWPCH